MFCEFRSFCELYFAAYLAREEKEKEEIQSTIYSFLRERRKGKRKKEKERREEIQSSWEGKRFNYIFASNINLVGKRRKRKTEREEKRRGALK